ncbi:MAG: hypothetical protein HGA44_05170 [Cellulomonadaceae bacterium]|nr:hypothetical protein [Cellulomonadaceae bacterium]
MSTSPVADVRDTEPEPWVLLIGQILARRDSDGAFRSDVCRGMHPHTQHWALPHVAAYMQSPAQSTALLRAAAITAEHRNAPPARGPVRLGHALRDLYYRREGSWPGAEMTSLSRRVLILPSLPLEQAALSIDSLVAFAAAERMPIPFYDLTRTLLRWGKGLSPQSLAVRQGVVSDFYTTTR